MITTARSFQLVATLACAFILNGCISMNIGAGGEPKRASGVQIKEPAAPFQKETREDVDQSWRHKQNGNAISYISDCQDASDPDLDTIANGVLSGLSNAVYDSKEDLEFRQREAKRILAHGKVDGVPTSVDLLVFKKNRCIYVLSYVALSMSYQTNKKDFDQFIEGFNPP
jgi:hypothetical protein